MLLLTQFKKSIDATKKATNKAAYRAMNKALSKARTEFRKEVASEAGIKTSSIANRLRVQKATSTKLNGFVSFGTQWGISMSVFSPKSKSIKIGKGKKAARRLQVSIKVADSREVVPNGFLYTAKSGKKIVIARKGKSKYPTRELKVSLLQYAQSAQPKVRAALAANFAKLFNEQLKYELK